MARRGSCVSCRVIHLAGQRAGGSTGVPEAFAERSQRSRLLQRLADAGEAENDSRWRSYRIFGELADQARRRAEAVVRLEIELRTLDAQAG
jgi:hypothetical protein